MYSALLLHMAYPWSKRLSLEGLTIIALVLYCTAYLFLHLRIDSLQALDTSSVKTRDHCTSQSASGPHADFWRLRCELGAHPRQRVRQAGIDH
jgi:hypothetical protein